MLSCKVCLELKVVRGIRLEIKSKVERSAKQSFVERHLVLFETPEIAEVDNRLVSICVPVNPEVLSNFRWDATFFAILHHVNHEVNVDLWLPVRIKRVLVIFFFILCWCWDITESLFHQVHSICFLVLLHVVH